ncbi:MAG: hypothetical protein U5L09_16990 [Bacteroidales bacterium]|nr:hypothetical protein [Bacteroidales bacterium]
MRMVASNLLGLSSSFTTVRLGVLFCILTSLSCLGVNEKKATSAPDTRADITSNNTIITIPKNASGENECKKGSETVLFKTDKGTGSSKVMYFNLWGQK